AAVFRSPDSVHRRPDARNLGDQRLLSRRQSCRADRAADVAVPHAGRLSAVAHVGAPPLAVHAQPADGDRRGLPVVAHLRSRSRLERRVHLRGDHRGPVRVGVRDVQEGRQVLRRRHLNLAIQLEKVTKKYRTGRARTFGDLVASKVRDLQGKSDEVHTASRGKISSTIWALRDVSLDVRVGAGLGIIGRNGAGKTTLLKLISRVTWPTSGAVRVGGHVVSLIELGAGFHPELTGRENVYLGAGLFGLTRREIDRQFDA